MISKYPFIDYHATKFDAETMLDKANDLFELMNKRRSVREFSNKAVDITIIENCIRIANTAPSGANKQPWKFCVVSNPEIKKQIRIAAEQEEKESYEHRMSDEWIEDLAPLGTDWHKDFLEIAPYLIVVFRIPYTEIQGKKKQNYYVQESIGIACGFLIAALHQCGLVSLTHTPSPMNFLQKILERPENEKAYLLIPVGYPADQIKVPDISRKKLEEIMIHFL